MKRGQTQQIFVWILVLVVAVSILFFGIKLIKKSEGLKDEVLIVRFFDILDKKLSQYYYLDRGSSGEEKFLLPSDVKEICFVNETGAFVVSKVYGDDGNLIDNLKEYDDVFIVPQILYSTNRYNLTTLFILDNNPECFNVVNGALSINLINEGITKGINITRLGM